jgi:hypothetical protein
MPNMKRSCRAIVLLVILTVISAQANEKISSFSFAFLTDLHISNDLVMLRDSELPAPREAVRETPFVGFSRALKDKKIGVRSCI